MEDGERPVTHETTVINTGGDNGSGSNAIIGLAAAVIIIFALFLFFGGFLRHAADQTDVNVNVEVPKVELPDIHIDTHPNQPAASQKAANQPSGSQPAASQSGK